MAASTIYDNMTLAQLIDAAQRGDSSAANILKSHGMDQSGKPVATDAQSNFQNQASTAASTQSAQQAASGTRVIMGDPSGQTGAGTTGHISNRPKIEPEQIRKAKEQPKQQKQQQPKQPRGGGGRMMPREQPKFDKRGNPLNDAARREDRKSRSLHDNRSAREVGRGSGLSPKYRDEDERLRTIERNDRMQDMKNRDTASDTLRKQRGQAQRDYARRQAEQARKDAKNGRGEKSQPADAGFPGKTPGESRGYADSGTIFRYINGRIVPMQIA